MWVRDVYPDYAIAKRLGMEILKNFSPWRLCARALFTVVKNSPRKAAEMQRKDGVTVAARRFQALRRAGCPPPLRAFGGQDALPP
jgi:hypothetical protein